MEAATVTRIAQQADLVVPYAGDLTHSHRHASEIAERLRTAITGDACDHALRGLILDFQLAHVELNAAGSRSALDHWLGELRIVTELQRTIDQVHDAHLDPRR